MTEQEFFQKMSDFHVKELKRSLIPNDEFSQKEFFDFYKEKNDLIREYSLQKQLEKELEEKTYNCLENALDDLLKGFNSNINIKL